MKSFTRVQEGNIHIAKDVIAEVVSSALKGIPGIRPARQGWPFGLTRILGLSRFPAISVKVDRENQVLIEVRVTIAAGLNIPDVAHQAQEAIRGALEKTVDIQIKDIRIHVLGIERRKSS